MNIVGNVGMSLGVTEVLSAGLQAGGLALAQSFAKGFSAGTLAGQCDLYWSKSSTLLNSTSETWTLSALTDALGRAVVFARVRAILIIPQSIVEGDDLTIGGAALHEWTALMGAAGATFPVKSLGAYFGIAMNTTGYIVGIGTSDQLKVNNLSTHSITYQIGLIGASV